MKRGIILAIAVVGLVAAAANVFYTRAHGQGWPNWHDGDIGQLSERIVAHLARRLDLSQDQQAQINQIIAAERPAVEPLIGQLAQTSRELRAVTADGQFDESRVRQLAAQQAQTITELIVAKERVKSKVFAVLTPEQRSRANEMLERFGPGRRFGAGRALCSAG